MQLELPEQLARTVRPDLPDQLGKPVQLELLVQQEFQELPEQPESTERVLPG